jgi:hypothetical protein
MLCNVGRNDKGQGYVRLSELVVLEKACVQPLRPFPPPPPKHITYHHPDLFYREDGENMYLQDERQHSPVPHGAIAKNRINMATESP